MVVSISPSLKTVVSRT